MAYQKTVFNEGGPPGISAAELNKIGTGIEEAHALAEAAQETANSKAPLNHTHDFIVVTDTRDVDNPPIYYKQRVTNEFKTRSAVGVPGSGTYCAVTTIAPWTDQSGGRWTQIAYGDDGNLYMRKSSDANTWGPWYAFARTDVRPTFAAGIQDGNDNADISLIHAVQHEVHTRSTTLTYDGNGRLQKVEEKNGSTVIKATTLSYDSNGRLSSMVETAGGIPRTSTLNYDANGNLISVTRA